MMPYRVSPAERALSRDELLARQTLAPLLQPGEELLWAERPRRGFVLHRRDLYFMVLGGVLTVIGGYWAFNVLRHARPVAAVWPVLFFLIGVYLLIFRHISHARERASMFYGLTDRRVIVVRGNRDAREFLLTELDRETTAIDFRGGGYTDIWLDERYYEDTQGSRHEHMPTMPAVPNGESVFDQIIAQRAAALHRIGRTP